MVSEMEDYVGTSVYMDTKSSQLYVLRILTLILNKDESQAKLQKN